MDTSGECGASCVEVGMGGCGSGFRSCRVWGLGGLKCRVAYLVRVWALHARGIKR